MGVVHDLTEELRLRDLMVRHERLSAIGEVVSGVAHEISNPLQSVMGLVELVQQGHLDADARAYVDRMHAEVDRAGRIIRGLHVFVRRAPYDREPIDLNETARRAVGLRRHTLERHGIRVEDQCAPTLPTVFATRDDLQQVVWQLVVNAEEAMIQGGGTVLTLRTAADPASENVVLELANDGPGIPPHLADRIFEPFFSTKEVGKGQGLGLSVAFGIVAAHGGSLELVPSERGACFRVTLPTTGVESETTAVASG